MGADEETQSLVRPGTFADLSRRLDAVERGQESQAREVASLSTSVARVENNQLHAEELNKLRFSGLETTLNVMSSKLDEFVKRVEGILTGEIETVLSRGNQKLIDTNEAWKATVEERFDNAERLETQVRLFGRLAYIVLGGSLVSLIITIIDLVR